MRAYAARRLPCLGGERVVLAASGGADSAAMVSLLCEAGIVRPARVIVAHFDHRLRGEEAARRDLDAVTVLCARYGLSLETGAWTAPRGGEAAARAARYGFLRATASQFGARVVVTGHTSDDQVETVLMHALRGAGLHGLAGMAAASVLAPSAPGGEEAGVALEVWRPLLGVSREETRTYCAARKLAYADDATNEDRGPTRNRIRLELLPAMEAIAPDARRSLLTLSVDARASAAMLDAIASSAIMAGGEYSGAGEVALSRDALHRLPAYVVPYAYRLALIQLLGDARDFGRVHYAMLAGTTSATTGSVLELPRGVVATVDAAAVVLSIGTPGPAAIDLGFEAAIPFGGQAGAWRMEISRIGEETPCPRDAVAHAVVRLPNEAIVRGRRPGDRVALRSGGHKKLQDLYVDAKIPRRERDRAPVIARGSDVLWTPLAAGATARDSCGLIHRVSARRDGR